jgi:hypothetical protein
MEKHLRLPSVFFKSSLILSFARASQDNNGFLNDKGKDVDGNGIVNDSLLFNISRPETNLNSENIAFLKNTAIPLISSFGLIGNLEAIISINFQKIKTTFHQSIIVLCTCDIVFVTVMIIDKHCDIIKDMGIIYPFFRHPLRTILI